MVGVVDIAGSKVGAGRPCFIIAEAGVNHNGSLDLARRMVRAAAQSGADAVKFQTFSADRLASRQAPLADYQQQASALAQSQYEMLRGLELSPEAHRNLLDYCRDQGILFLSSPFEEESADLLEELGVAAFKIPSGEITNLPFVAHVARKGKPLIVSTGMATLGEVEMAVQAMEAAGNRAYILLHCVSNYPAAPRDVNLRAMQTLSTAFQAPVGFSDHTRGQEVALAAVALGACVIEKHFTLDRGLPGPDHQASLEPAELTALVRGIRTVEAALGQGRKEPVPSEAPMAAVARKSLVAARDLPPATILTPELLAAKRPGTGLPPALLPFLIGCAVRVEVPAGTPISWEMLA